MASRPGPTRLRIRIVFGERGMIGPGKADLLQYIEETGSIAGAGRKLGMSYKRAWMLVETLNDMFAEPLVKSSRGGAKQGGAHLTEAGARVLALYRKIERSARTKAQGGIAELEGMLSP